MKQEYNLDKIRAILEGFRKLPKERIRQYNGALEVRKMDKECGACVGAWCAHFLNLPLLQPHDFYMVDGPYWGFMTGARALASLLRVRHIELEVTLHKNGAHVDPFGTAPWPKNPYDVLCDTVRSMTGYDHKGYLREQPVPLKEIDTHEVLETMP